MQTLKQLRESAGLNQIEISKRTGISQSRISLAENEIGSLTPQEEESVRSAMVQIVKDRLAALLEVDPPLLAMYESLYLALAEFRTQLQEPELELLNS
jgi:transcriptional regulator with XRE-family HTH domain